jgi:predicted transcriptional regulator
VIAMWLSKRPSADVQTYRTLVELHRIRRRFDVAQLKSELRRDAADARRALRAELARLDGRR